MISPSTYIFEAGGSKTDVLVYFNHKKTHFSLSGYNPNRADTLFINELKSLSISKNANIYFYGSGLGNVINQKKIKNLFPNLNITIYSDILGAARATLGKSKGIVCILGTGGVAAFYDGKKIVNKKGGYGYLIDDIGGGLELGKLVVSKWLNNDYNLHTQNAICDYFRCTQEDFTSVFYSKKDLHQLAKLCELLPELSKQDDNLNQSILNYFNLFFQRHVYPIAQEYNNKDIHLVGSIGLHFNSWIKKSAETFNLRINDPVAKPIENLLSFHLNEK